MLEIAFGYYITYYNIIMHCMHRVLWDANAHVHCPLIKEMLMHMCIGWNTTIAEYVFLQVSRSWNWTQ